MLKDHVRNLTLFVTIYILFCYHFDLYVRKLLNLTGHRTIRSIYRAFSTSLDVQQQEMLLPICLWDV